MSWWPFKRKPKEKQRVNVGKLTLKISFENERFLAMTKTIHGFVVAGGMTVLVHRAENRMTDVIKGWYQQGFFQADSGVIYPTTAIAHIRCMKIEDHWEEYDDG